MDLSVYEENFLNKSIQNRCNFCGNITLDEYQNFLIDNQNEAANLFNALLVNYSEFFRNPLTFALLEQWIIPNLIKVNSKGQEIRVWSAGCASGQEPYSVAMIFEKYKSKLSINFRYRIFATDISSNELIAGQQGIYSEEQISNIKIGQIKEYFAKEDNNYRIIDKIRKNVSFSKYDLLDANSSFPHESIFGDFDLVLCSNLLFYYREELQGVILRKMMFSMAEHGFLITGEAERHSVHKRTGLQMIMPPAPVFQKNRSFDTR